MSVAEIRQHAREIRVRLQRPPNAIMDVGIDLKRKKQPSIPLNAIVTITEVIRPKPIKVTLAMVLEATGQYYSFRVKELKEHNNKPRVSLARHIAFYIARKLTGLTGQQIAYDIGRDHTCGIHSERKINELIKTDEILKETIKLIEKKIINGHYS